jgi:ketosteroid isomerase-like protein
MTPEETRTALIKMLDDFWHKEDVEAAYAIYSDDVVFQRIPFPPVVGKAVNM